MSVPAENIKNFDKPIQLKNNETRMKGKISAYRRIKTQQGQMHLTLLTLPAPDEYSSAQTVELRSRLSKLGEIGDEVTVIARVGGFRRSYDQTDSETGEIRKVQTANLTLDVVEQ
jgi:hypothetical protein